MKRKVDKMLVRPALTHGLEQVAKTKRQEDELEMAKLEMLRFSLRVTRKDMIQNENIRRTSSGSI